MVSQWTWATAGPKERGMWVRENLEHHRNDIGKLAERFGLTIGGTERILSGEDWQPEFDRPAVNYIEG